MELQVWEIAWFLMTSNNKRSIIEFVTISFFKKVKPKNRKKIEKEKWEEIPSISEKSQSIKTALDDQNVPIEDQFDLLHWTNSIAILLSVTQMCHRWYTNPKTNKKFTVSISLSILASNYVDEYHIAFWNASI